MELYYDGYFIEKHASNPAITGFTTNCSIMSSSPNPCYTDFYARVKPIIGEKAFSLQIWKNDSEEAIQQVNSIHAIDPRIFVKIPVIDTNGHFHESVIRYCVDKGIYMNLTAIHTLNQIDKCRALLTPSTTAIVSIFAGPISDTGLDPASFIRHAKSVFADCPHVKILWAGCREIYTIERARQSGADIITIPDAVIDRMSDMDMTLETMTLKRVHKFFNDAESSVRI
jgi:transaldolase